MKKTIFIIINLCIVVGTLNAQVLYGTTSNRGKFGGGTINRLEPATATLNVIKDFIVPGKSPEKGLVLASNGKFYGVT